MATDQPGERPDELADERPGELAERLRGICLALPEVTERPSHSAPTWYVRDKKSFVTLWAQGHHRTSSRTCGAPPRPAPRPS
ncbi:MAG TPA: MmcQ/YjbR family DNA-binding protein [Streptosporangiaceae bacterium]